MKKFLLIILFTFTSAVSAQFNGGTFNNLMNVGDYSTLELIPGTKMSSEEKKADDLIGDLFGKVGLDTKTNENPIVKVSSFSGKPGQTWKIVRVKDNDFVIFSETYKLALTTDAASQKVFPAPYVKDSDNQIFYIQRDTLKCRYGFYLISKQNGFAVEVDKKSKELLLASKVESNDMQIWIMSLRKKLANKAVEKYLTPDKKNILFGKADILLTDKKNGVYTNWDIINHPTANNIYYIMNSFSKKFLAYLFDENGKVVSGSKLYQASYNKNSGLLFHFKNSPDSNFNYLLLPYPGEDFSVSVEGISPQISLPDSMKASQQWKLEEGTFSLF